MGVSSEVSLPQFKVLGHRQRAMEISLTTGTWVRRGIYVGNKENINETPLRGTLDRNSHDSYHVLLLYYCTKHYEWCEIVFMSCCMVN